ncbi:MAG: type 4a pilus biogenesis protein PilO, partial [Planctomycetota bacterium]|nr:type 4a pilus biogenesis protein PilO [Planctomycetota bacterium]
MSKFTEKQKLWTIGGTAFAVCLIAGGGVWWATGLITEVEESIEAKRVQIAAAEQKIARIPAAETEVIVLRENLDEYVKILPAEQGLNDFVKMLNQFEQQSGIQTSSFQPGRPKRQAGGKVERFTRIDYVYEMQATLWQFIKFINEIENYERFVAITDFTISQVNAREAVVRNGEQVHNIKLTMETYTYNDQGSGQEVEIPDYVDKKEMLREEIFKRMQMIRIDKYEHRGSRGRRDIFVDPREREGGIEGPPIEQQRALLERYLTELGGLYELQQMLQQPNLTIFDKFAKKRELEQGIEKLRIAVAEISAKSHLTAPQLRLRWVKEVVEPLAALQVDVVPVEPTPQADPYLTASEMVALIDTMTTLADEGDLEGADVRFEAIAPKLLVPESDSRYALAVQAKALHLRVKTAMEFEKLDLQVQGILVNHGGGRSGLLLNGVVF